MSETENAKELQSVVPSSALPWDKLKVSYSCGTKAIVFGFFVPPEARSSLPIPGGYENNVWPYTYMPIPGVEHKFYIINRVEGHCSKYLHFPSLIPAHPCTSFCSQRWIQ